MDHFGAGGFRQDARVLLGCIQEEPRRSFDGNSTPTKRALSCGDADGGLIASRFQGMKATRMPKIRCTVASSSGVEATRTWSGSSMTVSPYPGQKVKKTAHGPGYRVECRATAPVRRLKLLIREIEVNLPPFRWSCSHAVSRFRKPLARG